MIVSIEGILIEQAPFKAVVNVQGLGYEVHVPLLDGLPAIGSTVKLHTLVVYREDAQTMYGFLKKDERDFFRLLVEKVSGVGPRTALTILSKLSLPILKNAIAQSDIKLLSKCPGIGKKTAERLIIELKDKVYPGGLELIQAPGIQAQTIESPEVSALSDTVAALMTLGYKLPDADKAARKAINQLGSEATAEALIKMALG